MIQFSFRTKAVILASVIAAGLAACGGSDSGSPSASPSTLLATTSSSSASTSLSGATPNGLIGQSFNWTMIFEDDFAGTGIDTSKWARCIYWGITSKGCYENLSQLEWYMPANGGVANGILTLQARKEKINTPKGTFNYTSGFIDSDRDSNTTATPAKFDFQYGYVEVRAKVPAGKGLWPAFWMLPSDHSSGNEIDIMEILGDHPEKNYMTYHYGSGQSVGSSWSILNTDFSKDYHTYAVDWTPDFIAWYIDGVEQYRVSDKSILPSKPFFLIANLQVGGSWAGTPSASTVFPANYSIDYIRVWKKGDPVTVVTPPPAVNLLQNASFETGVSPWALDVKTGAAATLAQDSTTATDGTSSAVINTTQSSTTDWYVQFAQSNLATTANKQYTIEFMAKAETPRTVALIVQKTDSPYTEYVHQNVGLTSSWAKYSYTYISPVSDLNNKLSFSLGANTGRVWLDQLVFGY